MVPVNLNRRGRGEALLNPPHIQRCAADVLTLLTTRDNLLIGQGHDSHLLAELVLELCTFFKVYIYFLTCLFTN